MKLHANQVFQALMIPSPVGLLNMILGAGDRFVSLTPQLINNATSNLAETHVAIST